MDNKKAALEGGVEEAIRLTEEEIEHFADSLPLSITMYGGNGGIVVDVTQGFDYDLSEDEVAEIMRRAWRKRIVPIQAGLALNDPSSWKRSTRAVQRSREQWRLSCHTDGSKSPRTGAADTPTALE